MFIGEEGAVKRAYFGTELETGSISISGGVDFVPVAVDRQKTK